MSADPDFHMHAISAVLSRRQEPDNMRVEQLVRMADLPEPQRTAFVRAMAIGLVSAYETMVRTGRLRPQQRIVR